MTIILQNVDKTVGQIGLVNSGKSGQFDIDECSGLFVDWVSTNSNNADLLIQQTEIIENFIKNGKKIIIFDRYRSISSKEFSYLSKHNVKFWEPVLLSRRGFEYQPCWVDVPNHVDDVEWCFDKKKLYDIGYRGSVYNKLYTSSEYYKNEWNEDKHLIKKDIEIGKFQLDEYRLLLLLGSYEDCKNGYLDPIFVDCIRYGVIPVLPKEHKWYHAMFQGLIIHEDLDDLKHYVNMSNIASFGLIYNLLTNIKKYHTEMTSEYVMKKIIKHFK